MDSKSVQNAVINLFFLFKKQVFLTVRLIKGDETLTTAFYVQIVLELLTYAIWIMDTIAVNRRDSISETDWNRLTGLLKIIYTDYALKKNP